MDDLFDLEPAPIPALKPPPIERDLWRALDSAARYLSLGEPLTAKILGPELRSRIAARRALLRECMRGGSESEIKRALLTHIDMRGGFRPGSKAEARFFSKLRVADLSGIPLCALWEAANAFRRAEIGSGALRPTTGQLRKYALERAKGFFDEERLIDKVLAAPIAEEPTQADFERKKAMAERVRAEFEASLRNKVVTPLTP